MADDEFKSLEDQPAAEFKPKKGGGFPWETLIRPEMPAQYLITELIGSFFFTIAASGAVLSAGVLTHFNNFEKLSPGRALCLSLAAGTVRCASLAQ